jgi:hypothetical protein
MTFVKIEGRGDKGFIHYVNPAQVVQVHHDAEHPGRGALIFLVGEGGFGNKIPTNEPVESVVARLEAAMAPGPAPAVHA